MENLILLKQGFTSEFIDNTAFDIITEIRKMEESLVKQVLKDLLGRDPTLDDAKKTTIKFTEGNNDKYVLSFEDVDLGSFLREYLRTEGIDRKIKYHIRFVPNKNFK